jgi:hypothetical protein
MDQISLPSYPPFPLSFQEIHLFCSSSPSKPLEFGCWFSDQTKLEGTDRQIGYCFRKLRH